MDEDEIRKILWLNGLKNAVKFGGTPNKKAIMGKLMAEQPELRSHAKEINPLLDEIITEISDLNTDEQTKLLLEIDPQALDKQGTIVEEKELPELPNVKNYKKVIMRLAPYPSGALHIGNARMVVLNDEYVKQYGGELILFYDDTIGSPKALRDSPKAKYVLPEAYELIKEGLEWLGVDYKKVYYKSERLDIFYEYCKTLIEQNMAYVCFCSADEFREKYKNKQKDCPHRNTQVGNNLDEWNNMLNRKYHEGDAVVRLKTGMDQEDPALRDQIIMRISEASHPKVGEKYIVWPMLEFSWAIDDHLINVSHILRGADLVKEDKIEEFVWNYFDWKKAEFLHYGRLRFPDMKLSKTETRNNIQNEMYLGWDDPRTWSLQSLKMRGIRPEALRTSLLDLGMSIAGITFDVRWLYSKNQEIIDGISNRYFFVESPVLLSISGLPFEDVTAEPLLLPTNPEIGHRTIKSKVDEGNLNVFISKKDAIKLKENTILRLKDLFNIHITSVNKEHAQIKASYHSRKLDRKYSIIHWVLEGQNVDVKILKPDGTIDEGFGEINLADIPLNHTIQFERYGFVNPIKYENNELFCYFTH